MAAHSPAPTGDRPRKMLAMRGEGLLKKVEDVELARVFGRVIGRAFEIAGLTQQEIAFRLGYTNQSAVSRWVAGTETPQMAKLLTVDGFEDALIIALTERSKTVSGAYVVNVPLRRRA